jgi:hypothetical protein
MDLDASHEQSLIRIIWTEKALHPSMQPGDLLKLLYQAEMGADHLLAADPAQVEICLRREWDGLYAGAMDPEIPIQIIHPSLAVARVHLRPMKALGAGFDMLLELVTRQAPKAGSSEGLRELVEKVAELAALGHLPFTAAEVRSLDAGSSVPHHSPSYGPASYRILNDASTMLKAMR